MCHENDNNMFTNDWAVFLIPWLYHQAMKSGSSKVKCWKLLWVTLNKTSNLNKKILFLTWNTVGGSGHFLGMVSRIKDTLNLTFLCYISWNLSLFLLNITVLGPVLLHFPTVKRLKSINIQMYWVQSNLDMYLYIDFIK